MNNIPWILIAIMCYLVFAASLAKVYFDLPGNEFPSRDAKIVVSIAIGVGWPLMCLVFAIIAPFMFMRYCWRNARFAVSAAINALRIVKCGSRDLYRMRFPSKIIPKAKVIRK